MQNSHAKDYANHSFVAEVTWVTNDILSQTAYFGLGAADYGFRTSSFHRPKGRSIESTFGGGRFGNEGSAA